MSGIFNKLICLCLFVLGACKEPEAKFRILISYDGEYEFSSFTRLHLSLAHHTYDGPSQDLGSLAIPLKRLPSQIRIDKTSLAIEPFVSLSATVDSTEEAETNFIAFDEGSRSDRSVIQLRAREDLGHYYSRDSKGIYHHGSQKLEGCDLASFAFIDTVSGSFVKDATHVYKGSQWVVDADPASFQIVNYFYQKDARKVYFQGASMEGADTNTFQAHPDDLHARDATTVYYQGKKIEGADTASFQPLSSSRYAKDKNFVYFSGERIPEADVQTFSVISSVGYSIDAKAVFWLTKRLDGADPTRFRALTKDTENNDVDPVYATDGTRVYFQGELIPEADAATFEVLPNRQYEDGIMDYRARDKNHSYSGARPIEP